MAGDKASKYKNLGEFAYQKIRDDILSGEYLPGEDIYELKISEKLNISRTPVKNALYRLAMDGLVEIVPNKGYTVKEFGIKETIEITQAREAIEGLAARLACERLKPQDIQHVLSLFPDTGAAYDPAQEKKLRKNGNELHAFLIHKSGNSVIADLLKRFTNQIRQTADRAALSPARTEEAYYEHLRIVKALLDADGPAAERAMREHIANQRMALLKGLLF